MSRGVWFGLVVALVLGTWLRFWGIAYGIPHPTARPDEERIVGRAQTIFASGDWHPGSFLYPSLPYYLDAVGLHLYYFAGRLSGRYHRRFDFLFDIAVLRPGLHYRISRFVSALAGVVTVAAAFALSLAAQKRPHAALLAASAVAVCPLHVRDSHFATVDVTMTLFATLALVFAARSLSAPTSLNFAMAGAFSGLAISSKYNGGLVLLAVAAAAFVPPRKPISRLVVAAVAASGAFAVTSPYVLLRFSRFLGDMSFLRGFLYGSAGGSMALWDHLRTTLPVGLGWPLAALAAVGLGLALRRRRPADVVLLSFALPFFALVSSVRITFPRYVVPLVPVLLVIAAAGAGELLELVPRFRARGFGAAAVSLLLLAPALRTSIAFDRVAARDDTRLQAAAFVAGSFAPQTLLAVCRGYGAPSINRDRRRPPAYRVEDVDCLDGVPSLGDAAFLVTHEHRQLRSFSRISPALASWLEEHGELIQTFDPYRADSVVEPRFFGADAFYVPFSGIEAVERGGPIVRIWRIRRTSKLSHR